MAAKIKNSNNSLKSWRIYKRIGLLYKNKNDNAYDAYFFSFMYKRKHHKVVQTSLTKQFENRLKIEHIMVI